MKLSLIAAMADERVIGLDNAMPWHLPADLKHFRNLTVGKPVIMGRKTIESIGKALPKRRNIVVTRQSDFGMDGCEVAASIESAVELVAGEDEVMIIGGASIYEQTLERADILYLTYIHAQFQGDTHFPAFNETEWEEIERETHESDEKNPHPYSFVTLRRR